MPRTRAFLAVAVLLALAACSSEDTPGPSRSSGPSSPAPTASPTGSALPLPVLEPTGLEPIRTSGRPVWTSDDLEQGRRSAQVVGDLMLLSGVGVEVVDLRSGRTLWRAPEGADGLGDTSVRVGDTSGQAVLVDATVGPLVVLPYFSFGCAYDCLGRTDGREQRGIVALDALTGEPVWGRGLAGAGDTDYLRLRDRSQGFAVTVQGVSSTSVILGVGDLGALFLAEATPGLPAYAVGLDLATGERLWARPDVLVDEVAGDLVVGRLNAEPSTLVGLDARSGEVRWRSPETRLPSSVSPRVVVVDRLDGDDALLDSRTGRPLAQQLPPGTGGCAPWVSGDLDVTCVWQDRDGPDDGPRLLTLGSDGTLSLSVPVSEGSRLTWRPTALRDGVVTLDGSDEVAAVVDASGSDLLPSAPDTTVTSLDDRYVVLGSGGDDGEGYDRLEVLRRR